MENESFVTIVAEVWKSSDIVSPRVDAQHHALNLDCASKLIDISLSLRPAAVKGDLADLYLPMRLDVTYLSAAVKLSTML